MFQRNNVDFMNCYNHKKKKEYRHYEKTSTRNLHKTFINIILHVWKVKEQISFRNYKNAKVNQ